MNWLIAGLFGLVLLFGLMLLGVLTLLGTLAVLTRRWGRHRQAADDTLIAELLGWPEVRAGPAPAAPEEAESSPTLATPATEDDWLETQLAEIMAWSQRMREQIASPDWPGPFYTGESSRRCDGESARPSRDQPEATADPGGGSPSAQVPPEPAQSARVGAAAAA